MHTKEKESVVEEERSLRSGRLYMLTAKLIAVGIRRQSSLMIVPPLSFQTLRKVTQDPRDNLP
jgi:hypothetical protein